MNETIVFATRTLDDARKHVKSACTRKSITCIKGCDGHICQL